MTSALTCPHCRAPMVRHDCGSDLTVDSCSRCHGYWFDGGEIEQFVERQRPYATRPGMLGLRVSDPATSTCPRCMSGTLRWATLRAVPGLICQTCRGMFMSSEALRRVPPADGSDDPPRPPRGAGLEDELVDVARRFLDLMTSVLP